MLEVRPLLLVVDDDDRIRQLLQRYLSQQGYYVVAAANTQDAEELLQAFHIEAMVLDVMMPGEDGMAFLRRTGWQKRLPVMMLSARGEVEDRIAGLELGAHDYLPKPFEPKELLLRLQRLLQMARQQQKDAGWLAFGAYRLHRESGKLMRGDEVVNLTAAEQALLLRLAQAVGSAVSREQLAELLPPGAQERSVDVQINRLRRKLEQDASKPEYIVTMRGAGYALRTV